MFSSSADISIITSVAERSDLSSSFLKESFYYIFRMEVDKVSLRSMIFQRSLPLFSVVCRSKLMT